MQIDFSFLRFAPIIAFIAYVLYTTWVLKKFPLGGNRSISEHIAQSGKYYRLSSVLFSGIAIALGATLLFWMGPAYHKELEYSIVVILFLISGLGISWFPADIEGSKKVTHRLHVTSVFILYLSIFGFSLVTFFASQSIAPLTALFAEWVAVIYVWLFLLYFLYKPARNHFVFYETIAIWTFFVFSILAALVV